MAVAAAAVLPPLAEILAEGRGGEPFEKRIADEIRRRYAMSEESGEDRLSDWLGGVRDGFHPSTTAAPATGGGHTEEDGMVAARATKTPRPRATAVSATPRPKPQGFKVRGELKGVSVESAKIRDVPTGVGQRKRQELAGGALVVSIRVEKPSMPKAPVKPEPKLPYDLQYLHDPGEFEWEDEERQEGESEEDFKKRDAEDKRLRARQFKDWEGKQERWKRRQAIVAENDAKHEEALAKWQRDCEAVGPAMEEYARLAGAMAVYGGIPFDVTMTPNATSVRNLLPSLGGSQAPLQIEQPTAVGDDTDGAGDLRDEVED